MRKTLTGITKALTTGSILLGICLTASAAAANQEPDRITADIKRLTHSGNDVVRFPSLSDDGQRMLYVVEIKEGENTVKALRVMSVEDGSEKELFREGTLKALPPYEKSGLMFGSKPPVLSGDGRVAVFALSAGEPAGILDHYLGVVNTDGSGFWLTDFPIDALQGKDFRSLEFSSDRWERVSCYTAGRSGERVACVVKGHLGPRRYGNPSGVVFLDTSTRTQRTILAPNFDGKEWGWASFPCRPLVGGGWAFAMSGDGERVVFGGQSSEDQTDYDLYLVSWEGKEFKRVTDFHDRWLSMADMSDDGKKVALFYNGKKKEGMGTYILDVESGALEFLKPGEASRIEVFDMSGNGRYIFYKNVYKGMVLDLVSGLKSVAFDEETPGYVKGIFPMDYPQFPAFWTPKVTSADGSRILIVGPPQGRETPEVYFLRLEHK